MPVRVKICCIKSIEEAGMAISYGASALGLVGKMPSGPGVINDEQISHIARWVPPPVATFLLTSETDTLEVIKYHQRTFTNTIQIVDTLEKGDFSDFREWIPSIKIVQVIHVLDDRSVEEACRIAPLVDALLLDSGNPRLRIKVLGGTGKVHDWTLSRRIREQCGKPVFLAGGLNADNVKKAMDAVDPYGVDLCNGVRTEGDLDPNKLEAFFRAME